MSALNDIVWSPSDYVNAAFLARIATDEMLSRLDWMTLQPKVMLDAGCGAGGARAQLKSRYPDALLLSLDASESLLFYAKEKEQGYYLCADAVRLPLKNESVDFVFANFMLPWQMDF